MANWIINIPDTIENEIIDALSIDGGYNEMIPGKQSDGVITLPVANPVTKGQFAKKMIVKHVKNVILGKRLKELKSQEDVIRAEIEQLFQ